jgi:hypothetical protein
MVHIGGYPSHPCAVWRFEPGRLHAGEQKQPLPTKVPAISVFTTRSPSPFLAILSGYSTQHTT